MIDGGFSPAATAWAGAGMTIVALALVAVSLRLHGTSRLVAASAPASDSPVLPATPSPERV